jgi:hypothetical protein
LGRCGGRETRGRYGMTGRGPADLRAGARARISSSSRGYTQSEKEQRE